MTFHKIPVLKYCSCGRDRNSSSRVLRDDECNRGHYCYQYYCCYCYDRTTSTNVATTTASTSATVAIVASTIASDDTTNASSVATTL